MRTDHYLDHPDRKVRRWSAAAFSIATGGGDPLMVGVGRARRVRAGRWLDAAGELVTTGLLVWLLVAGIGLRIVRAFARRLEPVDQLVD